MKLVKKNPPIVLSEQDTELLPEKEWLKWREHGPDGSIKWTIGGSAVSIIMGCNPWTTKIEFFDQKKGVKPLLKVEYNKEAKEIGHKYEAQILFDYLKPQLEKDYPEYDVDVFQDKRMFQCGDTRPDGSLRYPYMVMNIDGLCVLTSKKTGKSKTFLIEIKTTSPENRETIKKWKDGIVPEYYEWQTRYYMAGLHLDGCFIACSWDRRGIGVGWNYVTILRDEDIEEFMLEECDKFIDDLENDRRPPEDEERPELALDYYRRLYGYGTVEQKDSDPVQIPLEMQDTLEKYLAIQEEVARYKEKIDFLNGKAEEEIAKVLPFMETSLKGRLPLKEDGSEAIYVEIKPSMERSEKFDEARLEAEYGEAYNSCLVPTLDTKKLKKQYKEAYTACRLERKPTGKVTYSVNHWHAPGTT